METYTLSDVIDLSLIDDRGCDNFSYDDFFLSDDDRWLASTEVNPCALRFREDVVRDGDLCGAW